MIAAVADTIGASTIGNRTGTPNLEIINTILVYSLIQSNIAIDSIDDCTGRFSIKRD